VSDLKICTVVISLKIAVPRILQRREFTAVDQNFLKGIELGGLGYRSPGSRESKGKAPVYGIWETKFPEKNEKFVYTFLTLFCTKFMI